MTGGMKIVIPEAKKAEFDTYVRDHLQNDGQQFFVVHPIDQKNLPRLLDAMYFQFVNGNLSDLVQRNAQTQNVNRLRRHVQQNNTPPKSGELPTSRKKTLGEL
jgi:hydroxypyruvate isomerase